MENKKAYRFFSEYTEDEKKHFLAFHTENIKKYLGQDGEYDTMIEVKKELLRDKLLSEMFSIKDGPIKALRRAFTVPLRLSLIRLYPPIRKSIILFGALFIEPITFALLLGISIFFLEKAKGNEIKTVFTCDGRFLTLISVLGAIWFLFRLLNIISLRYEYFMEVRSLMSRQIKIDINYGIETNRPI